MHALEALWVRVQEEITAANAFSLRDLKVDGNDIMKELDIPPGPRVGQILNALFERVLDEPQLNSREKLIELAKAMLGGTDPGA
jgi:poly(A) polymerase/tRNA nucleotidyltransferase (CCA-adding enzyme)